MRGMAKGIVCICSGSTNTLLPHGESASFSLFVWVLPRKWAERVREGDRARVREGGARGADREQRRATRRGRSSSWLSFASVHATCVTVDLLPRGSNIARLSGDDWI